MSGTTAPPVAYIDGTGIHAPAYSDILTYLQTAYQGIYGSDTYLGSDSQDGQLLALFAAAINDTNSLAVAVYNAFSPSTAQGTGLSSVVKINGISRALPSKSTVDVLVGGEVGQTITNGVISDANNFYWDLPASVTIPPAGALIVTATCETAGAVTAGPGEVSTIVTLQYGWQTVSNALAATPGSPVEADAQLRQRQAVSTALPAKSIVQGVVGSILGLPGVTACVPYENDSDLPNDIGISGNTLALVVTGGDATAIANTILLLKGPGCGTYGNITIPVTDIYGISHPISFYEPVQVNVAAVITISPLLNYTVSIGNEIVAAVAAFINGLPSGASVLMSRLYVPANLAGPYAVPASPNDATTFELVSIALGVVGGATPTPADLPILFYQEAVCNAANVTLVT
jgi:uncharacterized phage protein gp47/JayE